MSRFEGRENPSVRNARFALGAVALLIGLLVATWAVWLLATPDYDGGRHPFGGILLGAAVLLPLFAGAGLLRSERR